MADRDTSTPTSSDIQHESTTASAVNVPGMTALYKDGRSVFAPDAEVESWLAEGWSRTATDPRGAVSDLHVMASAMVDALGALVDEAEAQGEVDPRGALATAQAAFIEVGETVSNVLQAIQVTYPMKQGTGNWVHRDGDDGVEEMRIDPTQVELYEAQGWTKGRK